MIAFRTIDQTLEQLHIALRDYIEATYHISDPPLVGQRRKLLDEMEVIRQIPYLESTPRYKTGCSFSSMSLPEAAEQILTRLSQEPRIVHDPPYQHQANALVNSLSEGRSLIVITGTGSGKTECFLLPALGKLAKEAREHPQTFADTPAVRVILMYPMNALVNDQLGRLRIMFGDQRVRSQFIAWSGRPARFARYTSRTLYPGVRTRKRDQQRLKPIRDYYVRLLGEAQGADPVQALQASNLIAQLRERGKWPAKPDLQGWYGSDGEHWTNRAGQFQRCVLGAEDPEILTRHEALDSPPDVLITNYSMLEYMLMRPIERPIFDKTREWLADNPYETLLLVIDEAHLYRGAAGAEVALLLRRLRARLGVGAERIQVICTSASFGDLEQARGFAAQLSGKSVSDFEALKGDLDLKPFAAPGTLADAQMLATVDLTTFYKAESDADRLSAIMPFLTSRGITSPSDLNQGLYNALSAFPPLAHLINLTMKDAYPLNALRTQVFPTVDSGLAMAALTVLIALGSIARRAPEEPGLLPCRVHSFHRGLPGLWVCLDKDCTALDAEARGGPTGKLYGQPRETCQCGARVFELFTCRNCGTAYARAYTDNLANPNFLWSEPGSSFHTVAGQARELEPIDLLLVENPPQPDLVEPGDLDLTTGRLNPMELGPRTRQVFLRVQQPTPSPVASAPHAPVVPGRPFIPCGVCGQTARFGRSTVQDHQTKGDQPFQALVARQLQVQPPSAKPASAFAPLRGRKVLLFSDSRQTAARLAANIQGYSFRDTMRPLIVVGFHLLNERHGQEQRVTLQDLYCAILIASAHLDVRLRPEIREGENMAAALTKVLAFRQRFDNGENPDARDLLDDIRAEAPPLSLMKTSLDCLTDGYYGLESLALASVVERNSHATALASLPDLPGVAQTPDQKRALTRVWLRCWQEKGFWLSQMPAAWWTKEVTGHAGNFAAIRRFLDNPGLWKAFQAQWLPQLLSRFAEAQGTSVYRLKGIELSLEIGGNWAYCSSCRATQRPYPGLSRCVECGENTVLSIDPALDPVFRARKGYYRTSTIEALQSPPQTPMAFIAAEHTAQLNTAQAEDVFSKAEEHELLFQDIPIGNVADARTDPAIDVLSCTTTMEVGIDIGSLSGVALRNMPPARANYQQRAGRAGRRGNAVATVLAYGSADSHDEHFFQNPEQMIRGIVDDPLLSLNNVEIVRRHVSAYLLQRYHQDRLPHIAPENSPQLFEVLGTVAEFLTTQAILNLTDFAEWLAEHDSALQSEVASWIPTELLPVDRARLLENLVPDTMAVLYHALEIAADNVPDADAPPEQTSPDPPNGSGNDEDVTPVEAVPEEADSATASVTQAAMTNLLDRLLYKGVLPRYAFPTDVATFHVFDRENSTRFRPQFRYTPSQGMAAALSQYAPGREIWIDRKMWLSEAIYSPFTSDRFVAWQHRAWYYECSACGYAFTRTQAAGDKEDGLPCEACGSPDTVTSRTWFRPPGFAHPVDKEPATSIDDLPERSYATRAKLSAPTPIDTELWLTVTHRVRLNAGREQLLVTNRGPREMGYHYCARCGRIDAAASRHHSTMSPHTKPYPDRNAECDGSRTARGIVLGMDFYTDILLFSLRVDAPALLRPDVLATQIALRTLCEAFVKASTNELGLEPGELEADFRPALTADGRAGMEAEIYLYDTLPGGAGFSRRVGELGLPVLERALNLLENCPGDCDSSCYRCLRSFRNRLDHSLLDRQLGASLLRHLLHGSAFTLLDERLQRSYTLLAEDLQRNNTAGFTVQRNIAIDIPGFGKRSAPLLVTSATSALTVLDLCHPLTPGLSINVDVREISEYSLATPTILVDEMEVRRSLPQATARILAQFS